MNRNAVALVVRRRCKHSMTEKGLPENLYARMAYIVNIVSKLTRQTDLSRVTFYGERGVFDETSATKNEKAWIPRNLARHLSVANPN